MKDQLKMIKQYSIILQQLLLAIVIVIFINQKIFSQPQNFELKQISVEHGLPGANVRAIFQDSKHILWFGIESIGLCRYDGDAFTLYSNSKDPNSLGNNFVNSICEDTEGYLWIGTDNGLYKFDRNQEKFTSYAFHKSNENKLGNNQVYSVKVNTNGDLWVGSNNGLYTYDKKMDSFIGVPYEKEKKNINFQVNSICFDQAKNIWLATNDGLFKLDYITRSYTRWLNIPQQSNSLPNNHIKDLCFDQQGALWMVTQAGCVKFDFKQNQFIELKVLNQLAFSSLYVFPVVMMSDSKGLIWIGAEGMAVINPKNNTFKIFRKNNDDSNGLRSDEIRSVYEDKSGLIWIGTKYEGLHIYNSRKELFPHFKNQINGNHKGLNDKNVHAIYEDQCQNIWIGTRGGGLNLFDRKTGNFTYFIHDKNNSASISENNINVIVADKKNNLWIATSNYLERFDIQRKTFTHFPVKGIWSLLEDADGKLWVGSQPGLFIFEKTKNKLVAFHDAENVFPNNLYIFQLFQDKNKNVWIGTYRDGLFIYNPHTGKVVQYKNNPQDSTSISDNMIRSFYEDKKGRMWVGTKLRGLNLFDRSSHKFTSFTMNNGLPSNSIYCILEDAQENLWLATHNGVSRFNPELKTSENFDKDFGLQDNLFVLTAYCKSQSGEILFGGSNGFNIFRPEKIKKEIYYSPLAITSIKIFGRTIYRDVSKSVHIELPYNKNYLSFNFSLLDYYDPFKNQYQYQMEHVDGNWINCGNRHYVSYSSLSPGTYRFTVKAKNAYGIWNEKGLSVTITILPPWWKAWWFKLMTLLILIASVYIAYYMRIKLYRQKQDELLTLVEQRTFEIAQANDRLLERQAQIEEQAENLKEANDLLIDKQKLIEAQANELQNTNQQLSVLNSTKDRLFSIIAHDLRNPFHVVKGFVELLMKDYKKLPFEKIDNFLKIIYSSSINITNLLENILQWSRSQTHRIVYDPVHLSLATVAWETINLLETTANQKKIKIHQLIDSEITVLADENMLKTIFRNLIANAIKFTQKEGLIYVRAITNESQVEVTIEDTGIGIPQDIIPRLFEPGNNITTSGTAHETGTGLGLILCKEFIDRHNGKIWIESVVNKGSMFKFMLPVTLT